jgi:hypothetical protein
VLILNDGKLELPYEFTYGILATLSAVLSFCLVRINIKFAYYFYMLSKKSVQESIVKSEVEHKRYKSLLLCMYFDIFMPLLICIMFIQPLFEAFIVPDFMSEGIFRILRILVIVITISIRMLTFREEI